MFRFHSSISKSVIYTVSFVIHNYVLQTKNSLDMRIQKFMFCQLNYLCAEKNKFSVSTYPYWGPLTGLTDRD